MPEKAVIHCKTKKMTKTSTMHNKHRNVYANTVKQKINMGTPFTNTDSNTPFQPSQTVSISLYKASKEVIYSPC